jgi:hypothetical protein
LVFHYFIFSLLGGHHVAHPSKRIIILWKEGRGGILQKRTGKERRGRARRKREEKDRVGTVRKGKVGIGKDGKGKVSIGKVG